MDRNRKIGGQEACVHERAQQRDRARRVAARIGDELRPFNRFGLAGFKFGKAVGPAFRYPVRGRGVENARAFLAQRDRDRDGFPRGIIWEA